MRCFLSLLLLLLYHLIPASSHQTKEEDGFHRLLRRSATLDKFDRPLIREERNVEEDFENLEDDVITRKRRSNEDKFYQTLLSRTESKQQDKRSYDTEDTDNKAGFIIRDDWTGDSKISDADRQELENLFNTLNPTEEEEAKIDEVRDVKIEDEPGQLVEGAAKDYTKWLMNQKPSKFTKSLSHKVEVDHELTKMFYKPSAATSATQKKPAAVASKQKEKLKKSHPKNVKADTRFTVADVSKLPAVCKENTPQCICMRACSPRPVIAAQPCNCGVLTPMNIRTKPAIKKSIGVNCKKDDAKCLCTRACHPLPVAKVKPCGCSMPPAPAPAPPPSQNIPSTNDAATNAPAMNCNEDDAKCLCSRHCHPRPVAKVNPCDCGMPPAPPPPPSQYMQPAKDTALVAPFINCDKNDAKCLCTRTCHPHPVAKVNPCDCGMPPAPPPPLPSQYLSSAGNAPSVAPVINCNKNDAKCLCARHCHPRPVAKTNPCDCGMPPAPPPPPPSQFMPSSNDAATSTPLINCNKNDAKCLCSRHCHPRPVAKVNPCGCGMPPAPPPPPPSQYISSTKDAAAVAPLINCNKKDTKCLCARHCHPRPVAKVNPCDCGMPPAPPPPPPSKYMQSAKDAAAVASLINCNKNDAKCLCTRHCHPRPVAKVNPCDCGMPPAPPPPPPASAISDVKADSKSSSPAIAWCVRACKPRHVLSTNPCQCNPTDTAAVTPKQAKIVRQPVASQDSPCARSCYPRPVASSNPCNCGIPPPGELAHGYPIAAPALPMDSDPQTQLLSPDQAALQGKNVDKNAPARSSVVKTDSKLKEAKNIQSALNDSLSTEEVPESYFDKAGKKLRYLDTSAKNYQGCYKDKKPGRDLPRRYTRYAMTPEVCVRECKYQGYNFAGLQYSYLCFCGNAFGRYGKVDDAFCNSRCLGDKSRACGAFWHNSIYSIDGREFDPTDFDFIKVDAEEARKDVVAQQEGFDPNRFSSTTKANVANNLVKAAEAALKAAKKLLPDPKDKALTKKHGKHKREDDEDPELEEMKMSAMASISAAKKLLKRTPLIDPSKHKDKEKRSIEVGDDDWVNLDNGKDLLVAYLGGIDDYRRQTRSVDDEDDEDFETADDKPKFEYRRMVIGASGEGEFIEKYPDDVTKAEDISKRSISENSAVSGKRKVLLPVSITKRSIVSAEKASKRDLTDPAVRTSTSNSSEVSNSTESANSTLSSNATASNTTSAADNYNSTASASPVSSVYEPSASASNASISTSNTSVPVTANNTAEKLTDVKSISVSTEKTISIRRRRSLDDDEEPESDGVKKMAARGEKSDEKKMSANNEIKRQLPEKRSPEEDDVTESDFARLLNEETEAEKKFDRKVKRSSQGLENDIEDDYIPIDNGKDVNVEKRSTGRTDKAEDKQLRDHVEKGVEKLMALVVNLYKEQSTIRGFEDSVRDLKDDISKQLKLSPNKKDVVMKELREEIQKTAGNKLKDLTSSIRSEIKLYAKSHPADKKKVNTAISSIPDLPVSDEDYSRARRDIAKRGAELNDVEDQFEAQNVPSILKEHFKRNSETEFKGEKMLSRNHRNVPEDDLLDEEFEEIVGS